MKTVLPVKWENTELPIPERVSDEKAIELTKAGTHIYCPKAYYKQFVLNKPLGITSETVLTLIAKRKS